MDFTPFDKRHYPTLPTEQGYTEWADTYEDTVEDEMDLRLLARLTTVDFASIDQALDLACGTGRVGQFLSEAGVGAIDGIDLTAKMLERAQARGVYRDLLKGDILDVPLPNGRYALVIEVLADEHLPDLDPLYREAHRLTTPGGRFIVVGYHPFFTMMLGIPTHFDRPDGQSVAIETFVHLISDHAKAALAAGFTLAEMDEGLIDGDWLAVKPQWGKHVGRPVSFSMVWVKEG